MPDIAEPPPAPVQSGVAPPSAGKVINVVPQPIEPAPPPAPGSAREKLFSDLRKKAKPAAEEPPSPKSDTKEKPATPVPAPKQDKPPSPDDPEEPAPGEGTPSPAPLTPEQQKKVSPWKLVEQFKERYAKAEARILELEGKVPTEANQKQIESAQTRLKELEDEIRYVNYSKSEEFKTKYQQPYEKAWSRAMSELKELTVADASGNQRAVTAEDLMQIVNLPLGKAREAANAIFGDFADDVMAHRKEIRNLFEAQNTALDEARKTGAERDKQRAEQAQKHQSEVAKQIASDWDKFNKEAASHETYGKYFSPVEGDSDGNTRLEKGFELVDKAFAQNPMDPRLTPEQRAAVIRTHAVVRNRAAAFGRLVSRNQSLESKVAELTKELEQFKQSSPPTGGGAPAPTNGQPTSAWESVRQGLNKIAKPI
ncbi:MAG: hypothetical protein AUG89_11565 [Acidobacteria bacterium 13_1_20CM_4_56_7]|nr:MAG: hypothetical protein AUG89_11565 [Acidobacteria bacterium 13_1_20CM_4_56_7]